MANIDIFIPESFAITKKQTYSTPGLVTSTAGSISLLDWTNARLSEGRLKVSYSSIEDLVNGSYADNDAATTGGLDVGDIYYNTTTGKLATVQA